jgi:hypothetical protein
MSVNIAQGVLREYLSTLVHMENREYRYVTADRERVAHQIVDVYHGNWELGYRHVSDKYTSYKEYNDFMVLTQQNGGAAEFVDTQMSILFTAMVIFRNRLAARPGRSLMAQNQVDAAVSMAERSSMYVEFDDSDAKAWRVFDRAIPLQHPAPPAPRAVQQPPARQSWCIIV